MARVAVMVQTIALLATWKWTASVSTRKTTTKKSKASRVQPKKLAATACQAPGREVGEGEAGVEFERVSFFSSSTGANVAGEVYTGDCLALTRTREEAQWRPWSFRAEGFYFSTRRSKYNS